MAEDLEANRVYYEHDSDCDGKTFTEPQPNGLKKCLQCSGVFDADGNGVAVTDKRFDSWRQDG